jgi:hypothetical protein
MKKFLLIVLAAGLMFSCQKKDDTPQFQDVSFKAIELAPDAGLKSTADWICKSDVPTNAELVIDGTTYNPELFELDGVLYTQALKLPVQAQQYCVTSFILYKEGNNVPGYQTNPAGDVVVFGTPLANSTYEPYITPAYRLPYCFTVTAFTKAELPIEVLCYLDADYDAFGFDWFAITEIVIREQCFFGDFCIKHTADYHGSNYTLQSTWPGDVPFWDAPAIIEIVVSKRTALNPETWTPVEYSPFTNNTANAGYGVGAPVCIQYPDNLSIPGETFKAELYILVKQGNAFNFVKFHEWTFVDDQMIVPAPPASDGVVDFVLGSCNLSGTDLQLAPWQNLPVSASVEIWNPGTTHNTYWDIRFHSYTPAGSYDLPLMPPTPTAYMAGWCGDAGTTINEGTFNANLYSSLRTFGWPTGVPFTLQQIATVNWLMNHLNDYGFNILGSDQGGQAGPIQQAIWKLLNGTYNVTTPNPIAVDMYNDAVGQTNFVPLPGGWAAVLIIKDNDPDKYQLVFVVVDP